MTVRILIASATDMKHHLPVADGVILIGGVLREAIALESKSLSFTIVSLVQIDVKNCRKQYIQLLGSLVGIFLNVGYLKPVYHAIGKKETGEEFIIVWCLVWCHGGKGTNFSAQVQKSVDSPPGMLTEDHHHTVHEERQVCNSSYLSTESLHL